jgi:hypothetical protein
MLILMMMLMMRMLMPMPTPMLMLALMRMWMPDDPMLIHWIHISINIDAPALHVGCHSQSHKPSQTAFRMVLRML